MRAGIEISALRMIKMQGAGVFDFWRKKSTADPSMCLKRTQKTPGSDEQKKNTFDSKTPQQRFRPLGMQVASCDIAVHRRGCIYHSRFTVQR